MPRLQKDPLRRLAEEEREYLEVLGRAQSAPAAQVARAKILLAVDKGTNYVDAARAAGRKDGDAVSGLVSRFNQEGLDALVPRHGGGAEPLYGQQEKKKILDFFERKPERQIDGTARWSLVTLQRALRQAKDGLPQVSTHTIWKVLKEAGYTWQEDRSWCDTGKVIRYRKAGPVEVTDPDALAKKN